MAELVERARMKVFIVHPEFKLCLFPILIDSKIFGVFLFNRGNSREGLRIKFIIINLVSRLLITNSFFWAEQIF